MTGWTVVGPGEEVRCPSTETAQLRDRRAGPEDRRARPRGGRRTIERGGRCNHFIVENDRATVTHIRVFDPHASVPSVPGAGRRICEGCGMRVQWRQVALRLAIDSETPIRSTT